MITAIFYTDNKFKSRAGELMDHLYDIGFDKVISYTREWLETTDFYLENREILDMPRGGGYWLWKPFIILETMKSIEDGDIVFYMDAGDSIRTPKILDAINNYMTSKDYMISGSMLRPRNDHYTKRDCFILMGCDRAEYRQGKQIEAGTLVFRKTEEMQGFLREWQGYCQSKYILTDISRSRNYDNFVAHRHDQSILS